MKTQFDSATETTYLLQDGEIDWLRAHAAEVLAKNVQLVPIPDGLRVESFDPPFYFHNRGIRIGDLLRDVNGVPVRSVEDVRKACDGTRDQVRIVYSRQDKVLANVYRRLPMPPIPPPPVVFRRPTLEEFKSAAAQPEYHEDRFGSSIMSWGPAESWNIAPEEIEWMDRHLDQVFGAFKAVPVPSKGLRLESLDEASVLAARGLVEGDVLLKLDGVAIGGLDDLRAAVEGLRRAPREGLRIDLERDGRARTISYQVGGRGSFSRMGYSDDQEFLHAIQVGYLPSVRRFVERSVKANPSWLAKNPISLSNAVAFRRPNVARYLLDQGADVNGRPPPSSVLLLAVAMVPPDPEMVRLLLERGARVDVADKEDRGPILLACRAGDVDTVRMLLDKGAELDARDNFGQTPLMHAVTRKRIEMIDLLISRKANVKAADRAGSSVVAKAIQTRSMPILKAVIDAGGAVEGVPNPDLLTIAAGMGHLEALTFLKERNIISGSHARGLEPLRSAVSSGHVEVVRWLLREGVDLRRGGLREIVQVTVWQGRPLDAAILRALVEDLLQKAGTLDDPGRDGAGAAFLLRDGGRTDLATYLHQQGAPDLRNAGKGDPTVNRKLVGAVVAGDARRVQAALDEGADPEARDNRAASALTLSAQRGRTDLMELLIEKGADVHARGVWGETALFSAAREGHARAVKLLLRKGADPKRSPSEPTILDDIRLRGYPWVEHLLRQAGVSETPQPGRPAPQPRTFATEEAAQRAQELLEAIHRKDEGAVEGALARGADPSIRGRSGLPALSLAVETGQVGIVVLLTAKGAPLNEPAFEGKTPVMQAAEAGYERILILLVRTGADVDCQDDRGETALMKAIQKDRPDLAAVVLEKTDRIDRKNDRGATALHLAAARGQVALMAQLIDRGADVKAKMKAGSTPLGEAASQGQAEAIQLLVDRGSGVNDQSSDYHDERNWTPLMRAAAQGHEKAVEVLLRCKADVHYRNAQQYSALSLARERKAEQIEKMLLDAGARR